MSNTPDKYYDSSGASVSGAAKHDTGAAAGGLQGFETVSPAAKDVLWCAIVLPLLLAPRKQALALERLQQDTLDLLAAQRRARGLAQHARETARKR